MSWNFTQAFFAYSASANASGEPIRWSSHLVRRSAEHGGSFSSLTESITLVNNSNLKVYLGQIGMMEVGFFGKTGREALAEVKQVDGCRESSVGATNDEDPHKGGVVYKRTHGEDDDDREEMEVDG